MKKYVVIHGIKIPIIIKDIKDNHGEYSSDNKTITIDEAAEVNTTATLLHEILHAILDISGTGELLKLKEEEAIVKSIENGLVPLIKSGFFDKDTK